MLPDSLYTRRCPLPARPLSGTGVRLSILDLVNYMVYNIVMIKINVNEAKTHLSHYLEEVEQGETILLCRRNQPIAEIRPLAASRHKQRAIGLAKGKLTVPVSFFEELPADILNRFRGEES